MTASVNPAARNSSAWASFLATTIRSGLVLFLRGAVLLAPVLPGDFIQLYSLSQRDQSPAELRTRT